MDTVNVVVRDNDSIHVAARVVNELLSRDTNKKRWLRIYLGADEFMIKNVLLQDRVGPPVTWVLECVKDMSENIGRALVDVANRSGRILGKFVRSIVRVSRI